MFKEEMIVPVLECFQPTLQILLDVPAGVSLALGHLVLGVGGLTGAFGVELCL